MAKHRERIARLRRRAAFLRQRIKARGGGSESYYDAAEASALEWAVGELERLAEKEGEKEADTREDPRAGAPQG